MSNEPIEGYPILPPLGDLRLTRIADLQPYAKALTCRFIVLRRVDDPKIVKEGGAVFTYLVADDSASVVANFWNEVGESIKPGDIMLLTSGYVFMTIFYETI